MARSDESARVGDVEQPVAAWSLEQILEAAERKLPGSHAFPEEDRQENEGPYRVSPVGQRATPAEFWKLYDRAPMRYKWLLRLEEGTLYIEGDVGMVHSIAPQLLGRILTRPFDSAGIDVTSPEELIFVSPLGAALEFDHALQEVDCVILEKKALLEGLVTSRPALIVQVVDANESYGSIREDVKLLSTSAEQPVVIAICVCQRTTTMLVANGGQVEEYFSGQVAKIRAAPLFKDHTLQSRLGERIIEFDVDAIRDYLLEDYGRCRVCKGYPAICRLRKWPVL